MLSFPKKCATCGEKWFINHECKPPAKTNAERQAAWRARNGTNVGLTLPDDLKADLDAYIERQRLRGNNDISVNQVVHKLLREQLLRKR